jgi:hypothetical protein
VPRSESKAGRPAGVNTGGVGRKIAVPGLATADKTTLKRRPSLAVDMLEVISDRTVGLCVGPLEAATEVSTGWV